MNQVLPSTPATEGHHAVRKNISNIVQVQIPYETNGAPYEKRSFLGLMISATLGSDQERWVTNELFRWG